MPLRRRLRKTGRRLSDLIRDVREAAGEAAERAQARLPKGQPHEPPARGLRRTPPPPTSRRGLFGRKRKPPVVNVDGRPPRKGDAKKEAGKVALTRALTGLPQTGRLDALGFFIAAGLILAWPRERSVYRIWREEGWRGLVAPPRDASAPSPLKAEAAEPGRGRAAAHPWRIPARGWKDILLRTWQEFNDDRIMATAGGVTFFTLLGLFPAMAAFVSLYGLFLDVQTARDHLRILSGFLPRDALNFVGDEMARIASSGGGGLSLAFGLSLLLSLWSANGAVKALFDGLNVAYGERERRSFVRLNLLALAFTLGAIAFAILAVGAVVAAPVALRLLRVDAGGWWLAALRWPALLGLLALLLSAVYRFGPSRQQPRWRWITPGGVLAAVLWLAASLLFSWYVAEFANFNKTYGSLGAVVGFMTWLWYSTIIVLLGAELNAEMEHQTAVDTTTGAPLPMGERGARMADTLGPAKSKAART